MSPSQSLMSAGHRGVVTRVLDVLGSSASVVLTAPAGAGKTAVLDAVAFTCANRSWRLTRVAGSVSEPLGVRAFAAQLARRPGAGGLADDHVGQALAALTTVGAGRSPILLVVDGAETLSPDALRVIQLACEMQPLLQVLFAGRPEFGDCLAHPELARLRGRLAPPFSLPPLSEREAAALIAHRMRAAGLDSRMPAGDAILKTLVSYGAGNPGRIGAILDRALADRQGHAAVPSPTKPGDERGIGGGTAQAGFRQPVPRRADRVAATPMRSARRRLCIAVPAAATVALLGAVGFGAVAFRTSVFSHRTPSATVEDRPMSGRLALPPYAPQSLAVAPDQAATMPTGTTPPASDAGGPAGGAPAPPAAPAFPHSPDTNGAAPVPSEERPTVVVTPGAARSAPTAPTTTGDVDTSMIMGPAAPLPGSGDATRLANAAKPLAGAVPPLSDPGRTGRITALSTATPDDRRCRDILRRMQLGEDPTDVEKGLLRTGCRRDR